MFDQAPTVSATPYRPFQAELPPLFARSHMDGLRASRPAGTGPVRRGGGGGVKAGAMARRETGSKITLPLLP